MEKFNRVSLIVDPPDVSQKKFSSIFTHNNDFLKKLKDEQTCYFQNLGGFPQCYGL